jgi:glutamate/aspartate transport system substrate-binding protein
MSWARKSGLLALLMPGLAILNTSQATGGTLDKIKSTGTITFGYREASIPFSFLGADQKPVGLSIDLCEAAAAHIKRILQLSALEIKYLPVSPANRIPLIENTTIDIECGSTTNTPERSRQVAFSVPIFSTQPRWLVMKKSGLSDVSQLSGKTVVVTQGSLNVTVARKVNAASNLNLTFLTGNDQAQSFLVLGTGRALAFFEDDILLAGLRATAENPGDFEFLRTAYPQFSAYYGLMMLKNDPDLNRQSIRQLRSR